MYRCTGKGPGLTGPLILPVDDSFTSPDSLHLACCKTINLYLCLLCRPGILL